MGQNKGAEVSREADRCMCVCVWGGVLQLANHYVTYQAEELPTQSEGPREKSNQVSYWGIMPAPASQEDEPYAK